MSDEPRKTRRYAPPPEPRKRRPLLLIAGFLILMAVAGGIAALVFPRAESRGAEPAAPSGARQPSGEARPGAPPQNPDEEKEARALFDAAEALERSQPDRPDLAMARYREVRVRHPQTSWAAKAEKRTVELEERLAKRVEAEFDGVRREARALADGGNFRGAIDALGRIPKEILKPRADAEIAAVENEARKKFNATVKQAQELARKGSHEQASALFVSLEPFVPDDVRESGKSEIAAIQESRPSYTEARAAADVLAAEEQAFAAAPGLLDACRRRRYDEALRALDALPASSVRSDEREAVAAAAAFWDAFVKALRGRVGQDVSLMLADGKRAAGRLAKVADDRCTVGTAEVAFDRLHDDQVAVLALGGLPAAPASYAAAAMHFSCQGRRDLSRVYLATAKEMGATVDALERAWRGGILRSAAAPKK